MASDPVKQVSLYVPIITKNITEYYVKQRFLENKIGCVKNVDFVFNTEKNRREAFIHFKVWFNNKKARDLLSDIKNEGTRTQFIYYNDKFWPLLMNKSSKDSKNDNYVTEDKNVTEDKKNVKSKDEKDILKEKLKESKTKETTNSEKDVQVESGSKIEQMVKKVKSEKEM